MSCVIFVLSVSRRSVISTTTCSCLSNFLYNSQLASEISIFCPDKNGCPKMNLSALIPLISTGTTWSPNRARRERMGRAKNKPFLFHFIDLGNEIFLMTAVTMSGKICSVPCPSILVGGGGGGGVGVFF